MNVVGVIVLGYTMAHASWLGHSIVDDAKKTIEYGHFPAATTCDCSCRG
jgi:hypothetical protein